MGIQFRLGPNDHKPVEDFLSREHTGTGAITLDTKAARHQVAAAAAAVDAGLDVYWEPAAERLAEAGFGLEKFPLWNGQPYSIDNLSANQAARAALVDLTIEKHPALVTHVTARTSTSPMSAPHTSTSTSPSAPAWPSAKASPLGPSSRSPPPL